MTWEETEADTEGTDVTGLLWVFEGMADVELEDGMDDESARRRRRRRVTESSSGVGRRASSTSCSRAEGGG